MVSLLQRQLFKELTSLFTLCAGSLLTLLLIGRMLQLRDLFVSQGLGLADIAELIFYMSPFFLLLLIPIACMLSVFLTVLRMVTDREIVALRASGVSLYQLLPAPLLFFVLCAVANVGVSFYGLSWGMENFRAKALQIARSKTQLVLQPGVFNKDFPGLTIFAQQAESKGGALTTVMVQDRTREDITATILAPRGTVHTDTQRGELIFALEDGKIYRQEQQNVEVLGFRNYRVRMDLSKVVSGFNLGKVRPKEMSWTTLHELRGSPDIADVDNGIFARKIEVEIHKRIVLPLACIVLGLFALPVAASFGGLSRNWGLVLALGFFLLYYTLLSLGISFGETGTLAPKYGLWIPNSLFLIIGVVGIRQAARERMPSAAQWLAHLRHMAARGKGGADAA